MAEIRKILVVRLSSIGDIILTTPLLRSLKNNWPGSHITFVVKKQFDELLKDSPYIDELVAFDPKEGFGSLKKIKQYLKSRKFDIYLDIHKNWRSRYLRQGLGAGQITSYSKMIFKRTMLIWFKINLYTSDKPVYERYYDSVRSFDIHYDGNGTEIHYQKSKTGKARQLLSDAGYQFNVPLVFICPSATYFNKKWKPEGFIETSRCLIKDKSAFVVIHGGKADIELCERIASEIGENCVSMAGKTSLTESAALLKFGNVVIANDSGLLHLAQSQKVPVVGIYGATTRQLGYFPIDSDSTVIETDVSCRPCTHNGLDRCPRKHFRCMNDIKPESVIRAAMKYLP